MSKKLKLSPWHDGSVKPVHVGVYRFKDGRTFWYRKWTGKTWLTGATTVKQADKSKHVYGKLECFEEWQGVLK